jgi:hypothetical protein
MKTQRIVALSVSSVLGSGAPASAVLLIWAGAASAQTVISQPDTNGVASGGSTRQTFTPSEPGSLTEITVYGSGGGSGRLNVYGGTPPGTLLHSQPVSWSTGAQVVVLTRPVPVASGRVYAFDAMGTTVQFHLGPDKYPDGEMWLDYTSVAGVDRWWPWTECVEAGSCDTGDADWRFAAVIDAANPVDQVTGLKSTVLDLQGLGFIQRSLAMPLTNKLDVAEQMLLQEKSYQARAKLTEFQQQLAVQRNLALLSSISAMLHDTAAAIIQNIR